MDRLFNRLLRLLQWGSCTRPWYKGGHHWHYIKAEMRPVKCAATGTEYNYQERFNLYKCCVCRHESLRTDNY